MGILNMLEMILYLSIIVGVCYKILIELFKILFIPTYLGLIFLEDHWGFKFMKMRKDPKNGYLKVLRNILGSVITMSFMANFYLVALFLKAQKGEIESTLLDIEMSTTGSIIVLSCLAGIYLINSFSEEDEGRTIEKIDRLELKWWDKMLGL